MGSHLLARRPRGRERGAEPRPECPCGGARSGSGLAPVTALTLVAVLLGSGREPLLGFGKDAAAGLLDPADYVAATGLAEVTP